MISTIQKAIGGGYKFQKRRKGYYQLQKEIRFYIRDLASVGFSLDNEEQPPFQFLSSSPPKHLAKMCDGIIFSDKDGDLYVAIIEQKTGDSAEYEKQLTNGKLFCEWLISLCRQHGYFTQKSVSYFGLLLWEPRNSPPKGTTTHHKLQANVHPLFSKFFDLQNERRIEMQHLIEA